MANLPQSVVVESARDKYRRRKEELDRAFELVRRGRELNSEQAKKLRRSVANQLSLRRVRLSKAQYVEEMKKKITNFEETVKDLAPEVQNLENSNAEMEIQNSMLEERLKKCADHANNVDAEIEGRRAEIRRLEEDARMMKMRKEANSTGIHWTPEPEEDVEHFLDVDALYLSNATKNFDI